MNEFIRLTAGVLCVGVLAFGIVLFDLAGELTYLHRGEHGLRASLAEELVRTERLKQLRDASYRRVEAKWQVAKEVIAGQRSLAEAIEQFRDLDRQWPDIRTGIKKPEDQGMTEDECDGRVVIEQVRQVLAGRPDEAAEVAGRLEKELRQLLTDGKTGPSSSVDSPRGQSR
jgi:hypothetical protein